jgi:NitT/TauT family transport system ATP-binding protein
MRDPGAMLSARIDRKSFPSGRHGARPALRDIAFSVRGGEVVALLGPSGIGKSTVLRILLGLDRAYEGQVRIAARRIGVMFQEPRMLPWLDVAANLRLVVGRGDSPPDIAALLERVWLPGGAALLPRQLSLGMARRAALARALAVSPDLLMLDEPFASLDARMGSALGEVVADQAHTSGAAVLMATHDLGQALSIASRLLILAGGPATLAADVAVPADSAVRVALRASLTATFSFLAGSGDRETDQGQPAEVCGARDSDFTG